jgi:ABC-type antimicrobial peptide transport system permease subunit
VSANLRQRPSLDPDPIVYVPLPLDPPATTALLVRTTGDPTALVGAVREAVRALDIDLPVDRLASLEDAIDAARWNTRLSNALVIAIASIALLLAMIGLYTLTAHAVAQRTQEIGVRMALGAAPGTIAWLILRRVLLQLSAGLGAGVAVTLLWASIFEAGPRTGTTTHLTDPLTLLPVAMLLVLVALAACLWPAHRATRHDPVSALRCQ